MLTVKLRIWIGVCAIAAVSIFGTATAVAATGWSVSLAASSKAGGQAQTVNSPTSVHISGCTNPSKAAGMVTVTVALSWTVSSSSHAIGQIVFSGTGSPTTWTSQKTIGDNTSHVATFTATFVPGTYVAGVRATTATTWSSSIASSSNTFAPSTSGSSGSCTTTP